MFFFKFCKISKNTFIHRKKVPVPESYKWKLQLFYQKQIMMLSFFNHWDYRWKCEFDTDAKIEKYNDYDGEQLLFYEKAHIKTQSKTGCSCNLYIIAYIVARNEESQFIW